MTIKQYMSIVDEAKKATPIRGLIVDKSGNKVESGQIANSASLPRDLSLSGAGPVKKARNYDNVRASPVTASLKPLPSESQSRESLPMHQAVASAPPAVTSAQKPFIIQESKNVDHSSSIDTAVLAGKGTNGGGDATTRDVTFDSFGPKKPRPQYYCKRCKQPKRGHQCPRKPLY